MNERKGSARFTYQPSADRESGFRIAITGFRDFGSPKTRFCDVATERRVNTGVALVHEGVGDCLNVWNPIT